MDQPAWRHAGLCCIRGAAREYVTVSCWSTTENDALTNESNRHWICPAIVDELSQVTTTGRLSPMVSFARGDRSSDRSEAPRCQWRSGSGSSAASVTVTYFIRNRQNVSVLRQYERRGMHCERSRKPWIISGVRHLDDGKRTSSRTAANIGLRRVVALVDPERGPGVRAVEC